MKRKNQLKIVRGRNASQKTIDLLREKYYGDYDNPDDEEEHVEDETFDPDVVIKIGENSLEDIPSDKNKTFNALKKNYNEKQKIHAIMEKEYEIKTVKDIKFDYGNTGFDLYCESQEIDKDLCKDQWEELDSDTQDRWNTQAAGQQVRSFVPYNKDVVERGKNLGIILEKTRIVEKETAYILDKTIDPLLILAKKLGFDEIPENIFPILEEIHKGQIEKNIKERPLKRIRGIDISDEISPIAQKNKKFKKYTIGTWIEFTVPISQWTFKDPTVKESYKGFISDIFDLSGYDLFSQFRRDQDYLKLWGWLSKTEKKEWNDTAKNEKRKKMGFTVLVTSHNELKKINVISDNPTIKIIKHTKKEKRSGFTTFPSVYQLYQKPVDLQLRRMVSQYMYIDLLKLFGLGEIDKEDKNQLISYVSIFPIIPTEYAAVNVTQKNIKSLSFEAYYEDNFRSWLIAKHYQQIKSQIDKGQIEKSAMEEYNDQFNIDDILSSLDHIFDDNIYKYSNVEIIERLKTMRLEFFAVFLLHNLEQDYIAHNTVVTGMALADLLATIIEQYYKTYQNALENITLKLWNNELMKNTNDLEATDDEIREFKNIYESQLRFDYDKREMEYKNAEEKLKKIEDNVGQQQAKAIRENIDKYEKSIFETHNDSTFDYLSNFLTPNIFLSGLLSPLAKTFKAKVISGEYPITKFSLMNMAYFLPELTMNRDIYTVKIPNNVINDPEIIAHIEELISHLEDNLSFLRYIKQIKNIPEKVFSDVENKIDRIIEYYGEYEDKTIAQNFLDLRKAKTNAILFKDLRKDKTNIVFEEKYADYNKPLLHQDFVLFKQTIKKGEENPEIEEKITEYLEEKNNKIFLEYVDQNATLIPLSIRPKVIGIANDIIKSNKPEYKKYKNLSNKIIKESNKNINYITAWEFSGNIITHMIIDNVNMFLNTYVRNKATRLEHTIYLVNHYDVTYLASFMVNPTDICNQDTNSGKRFVTKDGTYVYKSGNRVTEDIPENDLIICYSNGLFSCHSISQLVRAIDENQLINPNTGEEYPHDFIEKIKNRYPTKPVKIVDPYESLYAMTIEELLEKAHDMGLSMGRVRIDQLNDMSLVQLQNLCKEVNIPDESCKTKNKAIKQINKAYSEHFKDVYNIIDRQIPERKEIDKAKLVKTIINAIEVRENMYADLYAMTIEQLLKKSLEMGIYKERISQLDDMDVDQLFEICQQLEIPDKNCETKTKAITSIIEKEAPTDKEKLIKSLIRAIESSKNIIAKKKVIHERHRLHKNKEYIKIQKIALIGTYFNMMLLGKKNTSGSIQEANIDLGSINVEITDNPFDPNVNVVVLSFDAKFPEKNLKRLKSIKLPKDIQLYIMAVNIGYKDKDRVIIKKKVAEIFPQAQFLYAYDDTDAELLDGLYDILFDMGYIYQNTLANKDEDNTRKEEEILREMIKEQEETIKVIQSYPIDIFDFDTYADEYDLFKKYKNYFNELELYLRTALFIKYKYDLSDYQKGLLDEEIKNKLEKGTIFDITNPKYLITYLKDITNTFDPQDLVQRWYFHFDQEKLKDKEFIINTLKDRKNCEDRLFKTLYKKNVNNKYDKEKESLWFASSLCNVEVEDKTLSLEQLQEKCEEMGIPKGKCKNIKSALKAIKTERANQQTIDALKNIGKEKGEHKEIQKERKEQYDERKEERITQLKAMSFAKLKKKCKELNILDKNCKTKAKAIDQIIDKEALSYDTDIINLELETTLKTLEEETNKEELFDEFAEDYKFMQKYFSGIELQSRAELFIKYKHGLINYDQKKPIKSKDVEKPASKEKLVNDVIADIIKKSKNDPDEDVKEYIIDLTNRLGYFDPFDFDKFAEEYKLLQKYFSGIQLYMRTALFINYKYNIIKDDQEKLDALNRIIQSNLDVKDYIINLTNNLGYNNQNIKENISPDAITNEIEFLLKDIEENEEQENEEDKDIERIGYEDFREHDEE